MNDKQAQREALKLISHYTRYQNTYDVLKLAGFSAEQIEAIQNRYNEFCGLIENIIIELDEEIALTQK